MSRILVTGGAGFIGNAVVDRLFNENKYEIVVIDNFSPQIHGFNFEKSYLYKSIKNKCQIIKGDICNSNDIKKALYGVEYIIHLASETGTGQSMYEIDKYTDVNIKGTSNIFQSILNEKIKIKKIILSSSRSVYGEGMYLCDEHGYVIPDTRNMKDMEKGDFSTKCPICNAIVKLCPTNEKCELKPLSYYAYTKFAQEKMLEVMCPALNIPYTIFRYQNVYGVGQSLNNPYTGILSIFSKLLLSNELLNIFEDGEESRDFVNVKDVASITCNALENSKTNNECVNVGSGENISVMQVAKLLKECYLSTSDIKISGDFRKGDIRHNKADISKAKKLCGFHICYDFNKGINEFVEWVKLQIDNKELELDNKHFECSLTEMKEMGMLIKR